VKRERERGRSNSLRNRFRKKIGEAIEWEDKKKTLKEVAREGGK
jgi:hypothetical protein